MKWDPSQQVRVLTVDDQEDQLEVILRILTRIPELSIRLERVIRATTGKEALKKASPESAEFEFDGKQIDLLITDFQIGDMTGLEVIKGVREAQGRIVPAICLSGTFEPEQIKALEALPCVLTRQKPYNMSELSALVMQALTPPAPISNPPITGLMQGVGDLTAPEQFGQNLGPVHRESEYEDPGTVRQPLASTPEPKPTDEEIDRRTRDSAFQREIATLDGCLVQVALILAAQQDPSSETSHNLGELLRDLRASRTRIAILVTETFAAPKAKEDEGFMEKPAVDKRGPDGDQGL